MVGLALRNVRLDSELQASLEELRQQAEELHGVARSRRRRRRRRATADRTGHPRRGAAAARRAGVQLRLARELADPNPPRSRPCSTSGRRRPGYAQEAPRPRPRDLSATAPGRGLGAALRRRRQGAPAPMRHVERPGGVATRRRSRRRCTSAASKRSRTRRSTPARARVTVRVWAEHGACSLRSPTTERGSTSRSRRRRRAGEHARPRGRDRRQPLRRVRARAGAHDRRGDPARSADMTGPQVRVLVVDDQALFRRAARAVCRDAGLRPGRRGRLGRGGCRAAESLARSGPDGHPHGGHGRHRGDPAIVAARPGRRRPAALHLSGG